MSSPPTAPKVAVDRDALERLVTLGGANLQSVFAGSRSAYADAVRLGREALATPPAHSHQQGRCGTCKHFAADVAHKPYGSCERWHTGYGYKINALPAGEVLVENDEGWAMVMGPEFGCVLHESITDPKAAAGEFESIKPIEAMRNRLAAGETTFTLDELKLVLNWADHLNYFLSEEKRANQSLSDELAQVRKTAGVVSDVQFSEWEKLLNRVRALEQELGLYKNDMAVEQRKRLAAEKVLAEMKPK